MNIDDLKKQKTELEQLIKDTQKALDKINLQLSKTPLVLENDECVKLSHPETIGFFYIAKAKKILTALWQGKRLLFEHCAYSPRYVYMNPQRNRIFVTAVSAVSKPNDQQINEDNIMNFIVRHGGNWYVVPNPDDF